MKTEARDKATGKPLEYFVVSRWKSNASPDGKHVLFLDTTEDTLLGLEIRDERMVTGLIKELEVIRWRMFDPQSRPGEYPQPATEEKKPDA